MSKGWFVFLLGISTLIMFPYQVYGEESNYEKKGLLSESITKVNSTLNNTLPVEKVEEVITVVEPVVGIVKEVEEQTSSAVEHVVNEVPPTTESIVSDVMNIVDETVETIPEPPIVTPILTEVSGSLKKVTNKVQETVEEGSSTVLAVIDKKDISKPEEKSPINIKQQKQVEEPSTSDTVPLVEESKIPQESTIPTVPPEESSVPVVQESPQQSKGNIAILEKESVEILEINQDKELKGKADKEEVKKSTNKSSTVLPSIPDKQKKKVMVTSIPTTSTNAPSSASNSVVIQGGDTQFALLPSQERMKELMRKKWYHKNHYAIIQWIHTPLRKPPEMTPFYT